MIIGTLGVIASIEGRYSLFSPGIDLWRNEKDSFTRSWEERFVLGEYQRVMKDSISGLMKSYNTSPREFSKAVLHSPDGRNHTHLARSLGFDSKRVQDSFFAKIGNLGNASAIMMLTNAFENAQPGDKILLANYGDGSDCFILHITDEMKNSKRTSIEAQLNSKKEIGYAKYLKWRRLLEVDEPRRPPLPVPSITCLWREQKKNLALYGSKCKKCGTVQYPPQRICIACQSKDYFENYKFSDDIGKVFTYTVDYLARSLDPPTVFPIIDFERGGRISCAMTDCEPSEVYIGMDVEMTFRKLYEAGSVYNYYWKAKPSKRE